VRNILQVLAVNRSGNRDNGKENDERTGIWQVSAWVMLMLITLNVMKVGMHTGGTLPLPCECPTSEADELCGEFRHAFGGKGWEAERASKRVQYDGAVVSKAADISFDQSRPAFPPRDSSSRDAATLCTPVVAERLRCSLVVDQAPQ